MEIIFLMLFIGVPTLIGYTAKNKNRSWARWALPAILPGLWIPLGIAIAMASHLCPKCRKPLSPEEFERSVCPRCGKIEKPA